MRPSSANEPLPPLSPGTCIDAKVPSGTPPRACRISLPSQLTLIVPSQFTMVRTRTVRTEELMLGGRLPPVGRYPDGFRVSSSYGAANLSISAPISKGCCRREAANTPLGTASAPVTNPESAPSIVRLPLTLFSRSRVPGAAPAGNRRQRTTKPTRSYRIFCSFPRHWATLVHRLNLCASQLRGQW